MTAISLFAACILFAIGLLHVFWAFGGKWGVGAVIPRHNGKRAFTPGIGATLVVALLVGAAGVILLVQANLLDLSGQYFIVRMGAWVCAGVFAVRVIGDFHYFGIFKKKATTLFSKMDTYLYVPLCAFLSLVFIIAIVSGE
ncbi:DUF3995 domain-containing protein [Paenibacillus hemerocallicola]|uniref:DUF3995 domain-containing protein n=1 Tax=Paenibacillus hemerocallicola TaxID=1172614 RepID=A0A5C4T100_9BACL|nr:DUF3995 domain-containing protein [Paenibacillus hemerocallicola]TNJ62460.1 DUF3995 domain-containing protein [Paenibacillus hemerocallicola]